MIQTSLQYTANCLDQYLVNRFQLDESIVSLNGVVDADGSIPEKNKNKLVVSLINIDKETTKSFHKRATQQANGSFAIGSKTERYNLNILLSANFDDYNESLKFLSSGILFFQNYPVLDRNNFSNLPEDVQKLEFDMDKVDYYQIHNLWTSLGAKYQPSAIFKMWLITLESDQVDRFVPGVNNTENPVMPN